MNNEVDCLDCCHCACIAFTGELECEIENPEFPDKCEEYEKCYKGNKDERRD